MLAIYARLEKRIGWSRTRAGRGFSLKDHGQGTPEGIDAFWVMIELGINPSLVPAQADLIGLSITRHFQLAEAVGDGPADQVGGSGELCVF